MARRDHSGAGEELWVCELGLVGYGDALALQQRVREARTDERVPDTLLLLEHPPVLTRGRRSAEVELLHDEAFYNQRGIELHDSDRGGRITYHGPGQLVGYPVMRITDVGAYLRAIEAALIAALAQAGVHACSRHREGADFTGVWVAQRKIASIGVHVRCGVTTHGFAINVSNQLEPFSLIVACGLPGVTMTSLARELPAGASLDERRLRQRVAEQFARAQHKHARPVSADALRAAIGEERPRAELIGALR